VNDFPPMNLRWSNLGQIFFPRISPEMGKHCDLGHIVDPQRRHLVQEHNTRLGLSDQLAFDLMVAPNHRGHIIGPGEYRLKLIIAADNAHPRRWIIEISLRGLWDADEERMLRDGIGITVTAVNRRPLSTFHGRGAC